MATITMPHRTLIRWQDGDVTVEYKLEPLNSGVVFCPTDPRVVGDAPVPEAAESELEAWLRRTFSRVEVDRSAKPTF